MALSELQLQQLLGCVVRPARGGGIRRGLTAQIHWHMSARTVTELPLHGHVLQDACQMICTDPQNAKFSCRPLQEVCRNLTGKRQKSVVFYLKLLQLNVKFRTVGTVTLEQSVNRQIGGIIILGRKTGRSLLPEVAFPNGQYWVLKHGIKRG